MDLTARNILTTGLATGTASVAAAAAASASPGAPAQQPTAASTGKFYEKGPVRIYYEEAGSGFPLLLIPGGGLNSTIATFAANNPFNAIAEFKDNYRCIAADLRNAPSGQSTGPVEVDRTWDSYADDQLGLMDHLGIDKFFVMGFCIGGPFIWNLLKRAPNRVVAGVLAQPVRFPAGDARPQVSRFLLGGLGRADHGEASRNFARHHRSVCDQYVRNQRGLRLHRHARFRAQLPDSRADSPR